jgi:hypothetical protein
MTLLVCEGPTLQRSLSAYFMLRRPADHRLVAFRPHLGIVVYGYFKYVLLALALLVSYDSTWTLEDVGLTSPIHWTGAIAIGLVAGVGFNWAIGHLWRRLANSESSSIHNISLVRQHLPRGRTARMLSHLDTAVVGPIGEEIVHRGFFVYYVGETFGSPVAGMVAGLISCLWLHLHLGNRRLVGVVAFFFTCAALLYSPGGLLAAIVFHIFCNVFFIAQLKMAAARYRAWLAATRASRVHTPAAC